MRRIVMLLLTVIGMLMLAPAVTFAQSAPMLAYLNAGGQLVIADAGGDNRWIVSNPGEVLAPNSTLAWTANGQQLFFAVSASGQTSLRVANVAQRNVREMTVIGGNISGGEWADGNSAVIVGTTNGLNRITLDGTATLVAPNGQTISGRTVAKDGRFLLYGIGGGLATDSSNGGNPTALDGANDPRAAGLGLWADSAPIVAYWTVGSAGTSRLNITPASAPFNTLIVDSGTGVPLAPLAWVPNSTILIYRGASGVQAVDAACVQRGGCGGVAPVRILPISAANVTVSASGIVYTLNGGLFGAPISCINAGDCSGAQLDAVAASTTLAANGDTLVYVGADSVLRALSLACLSHGGCAPSALNLSAAVYRVSPDGRYALVTRNGELLSVRLNDGSAISLTGLYGAARAVWAGEVG
jgi:hypothetical protein